MNPNLRREGKAGSTASQSHLSAGEEQPNTTHKGSISFNCSLFQMNDKKLLLPVPPPQENKPQLRSVSTSRVLPCFHVGFGEGSAYQFTPR